MQKVDFEPLTSEACIFINRDKSIWIILYVNNIAIMVLTKEIINSASNQLGSIFTLTLLGEIKTFLGMQIVQNKKMKIISINQEPYIDQVLGKKGWT
jgi:hypothetical protein